MNRLLKVVPLFLALFTVEGAGAESRRVLPAGEQPRDIRLQPVKDLDGYFPFTPPSSVDTWSARAERVRQQMRVALGISPMPEKTPLAPVIHGRVERDDYTVEKVYFQSAPGFFVTGNLYRPKNVEKSAGKVPGVLCPHGHWPNGRFMDAGEAGAKKEIASGAEQFLEAARSPLQARCVHLARMGCVVFHYDMLGYADSVQIPSAIAHGFAKQRPEMNRADSWGLFSPQAESHAQSIMGLQTLNSLRALDFLVSLPEVDPNRIGVTGASGGGTQTFIQAAIDPRVTAAFPAVMVSTAMQGGCTCENASLLRVGTGNIELAALFAPKPMGLTAADDWTKEMPTKGYPELQKTWALLGAPDKVRLWPLLKFPHNYNGPSRAGMYEWFNKHLKLDLPQERLAEREFVRLTRDEMSVWDAQHPAPKGGDDFERTLLRWWHEDAQRQLFASPEKFREIASPAWEEILGRTLGQAGDVALKGAGASSGAAPERVDRGAHYEISGLLSNTTFGEELPLLALVPKKETGRAVIWLDERGKAGLYGNGDLRPEVRQLLDAGCSVIGVDLLFQGEFLTDGQPLKKTRRVKNPRESAAYTFGYNRALFAQRVSDVLSVAQFVRATQPPSTRLAVVALDSTGPIAAAARFALGEVLTAAVINTGGFRFAKVADLHAVNFLPAAAKYGDLPGLLALASPSPLYLVGEGSDAAQLSDPAFRFLQKDVVSVESAAGGAMEWLTRTFSADR